jgi:hypothetical protein
VNLKIMRKKKEKEKKNNETWGCSSVVQHAGAWDLTPSTANK